MHIAVSRMELTVLAARMMLPARIAVMTQTPLLKSRKMRSAYYNCMVYMGQVCIGFTTAGKKLLGWWQGAC
jgi:hypothetical protein